MSFDPCAGSSALEAATNTLLELYPDIPALGCPFNTGNNTFGISPIFKQAAALCNQYFTLFPMNRLISSNYSG
jgi:hypothetical protein